MAKLKDSKCIKLISAMLIGSMLLAGCSKAEETTKKKKSKKSNTTSQAEETTSSEEEEPEESQGAADPKGTKGKNGNSGKGAASSSGTYHLDTKYWSADIPEEFQYYDVEVIDTDDENYYVFDEDQYQHDASWVIHIRKEDASVFRKSYATYFSMIDYAKGDLPTREIYGYDFIEFNSYDMDGDSSRKLTNYLYRYEAGSLTVVLSFDESGDPDDFYGWKLFDTIQLNLPNLGLSDPPFGFLSGEHRSEVKEQKLLPYNVTPEQGHFSEHVYITSENGIVPFSSTATHVAVSDKYLYTFTLRKDLVTIYQINGDEMTKVAELPYTKSTDSATLLDNDTVTCIPDPEDQERFILVETINGQEKILSCLNEVEVSPDGQTIISYDVWADQVRLLHREPYAKTMTSSPFNLEIDPSFERPEVRSFFFANNGIFATMREAGPNATERLFEFDLDGKAIREIKDDTRKDLYVGSVYDFRNEILMDNYEDGTLELWSKDGKLLSTISIYELIGIPKDDVEFPHYSFLKTGSEGDFLLLFAYDNDGVLEDLVYKIHIG